MITEPGDEPPDFPGLDPLRQVMVSTYPGYHLPHVWLARDGQSPRMSALDLAGHGRFTLLTGIGGDSWLLAAKMISLTMGLRIAAYRIGFAGDYMDCYREWEQVRGVDEDGVVLVRPDHFVAWRCASRVDDAEGKLQGVMSRILGTQ